MSLLILGANSLIAQAAASHFAEAGHEIIFAGRKQDEPEKYANDFAIRYKCRTRAEYIDALDYPSHKKIC